MFTILAALQYWDQNGHHTDNIGSYVLLLLFKLGLDMVVFYLCCQKTPTYFFSVCCLSITLADMLITFLMAAIWLLGAERSFVSPCFILCKASVTYGILPLPMLSLGLLLYCLENFSRTIFSSSFKGFRNVSLILLLWSIAVTYSLTFVDSEPVQLEYETSKKVLVCEVQESRTVSTFTLTLFIASVFILLPFWPKILPWLKGADKLEEARQGRSNISDLLFISGETQRTDTKRERENCEGVNFIHRPPLWFSLTLGFCSFWMPYLIVSVVCLLCGLPVPAYISVNLLFLECANSLLTGVIFWVNSKTSGPYSNLPQNVCMWQIYWHLSEGTQQPILPLPVFNPTKKEQILTLI